MKFPPNKNFIDHPAMLGHFAAIVESSDDAIISKNLNSIITSWNKAAERIFGYTAEEAVGQSVLMLIPVGRHNEEPEILKKLKAGQRIDHYRTVRQRKDGQLIDVSLTVSPIYDAQGKIIGASKIARDITAEKQAEIAGLKLAAIIESSDDAIISKDLNGTVLSWNKGAEEIFGYKAEEMIGQSILTLLPKDRLHEESDILGKLRRKEKIDHYQTIRVRKDGRRIAISLTVSPILDRQGNVIGASKIARDITKQRDIEDVLEKTNRELKELTATLEKRVEERTEQLRKLAVELIQIEEKERKRLAQILHDHLQQLLVAAKMKIEVLQRKQPASSEQAHLRELKKFVDDAFDTSRSLTAELRPPVLYESGLIPALRFLVRKFNDQYQFAVEAVFDESAEPSSVHLKTMLYATIQEILFNSVKYSGSKRCSLSVTRLKDARILVVIKDAGIGFDSEKIGQKGSQGFGLFSIRERMKAFGGEFKIESSPGKGANFKISMPDVKAELLEEAEHANNKVIPTKMKGRGLSVLLVDDHKILRQSLASLLGNQTFIGEINEAEDGQDAIHKLSYLQPDVILMDLNMPRLNGLEATRIIHEKYPKIKIIGLSVQIEPETMQAMKDGGAIGYFSKGEETEVLMQTLEGFAVNSISS